MPSFRIVGADTWEIEKLVREAQQVSPDSGFGLSIHQIPHLAAMGTTPLMSTSGFQPRLFQSQEAEAAFSSIQVYLTCCKEVWQTTHATLTHSSWCIQCLVDLCGSPAPQYQPRQKV